MVVFQDQKECQSRCRCQIEISPALHRQIDVLRREGIAALESRGEKGLTRAQKSHFYNSRQRTKSLNPPALYELRQLSNSKYAKHVLNLFYSTHRSQLIVTTHKRDAQPITLQGRSISSRTAICLDLFGSWLC